LRKFRDFISQRMGIGRNFLKRRTNLREGVHLGTRKTFVYLGKLFGGRGIA
jgi:hypothetical protein